MGDLFVVRDSLLEVSYELGQLAYIEGLGRIPALDESFMVNVIEGLDVGEGSVDCMREWYRGWDSENLAYTVE